MSRKIRLLSVMMAAVMGLSAVSAVTAFAEEENGNADPVVSEIDGDNEDPAPPEVHDFTEAPYVPDQNPDHDPNPDPYYPDNPSYEDGGNSGSGNSGNSNSGSHNGWSGYDGESDYNNSETFYVGGGQTYIPPKATAPSAALYNSDKKTIDDKELNKSDWGDIASKLKSAGTIAPSEDDGTGDFNFIQKNTAKEDNGHWIIITGVLCLLLSLAGFIYLIASAISRRRRLTAPAAGSSAQGYYRADDDYDDGYQGGKKEKSPKNGKRYK